MKKVILYALAIGFAWTGLAHAVRPLAKNYVTEAIYFSSNTAATQPIDGVTVSSGPMLLKGVVVNTIGINSSLLVYDASQSTSASTAVRIANIDTSSTTACNPCDYEVYMASGIAIFNVGDPPADITLKYMVK